MLTIEQIPPLLLVLLKVLDKFIEQLVLALTVAQFKPCLLRQPIWARI